MKRVLDEEVIDTFDITGLPRDVKIFIAQKLSVPDFMNIAQTNKLFAQASENGETWKMPLRKNTSTTLRCMTRYTGNNDVGNAATCGMETLAAGDSLTLHIVNTSDNDNPTILCGSFTIEKIK